jgi:hypothetical protein
MSKVKDLWERVQEMFRQPTDLERWLESRYPTSAADLEHLLQQWNHKQYRDIY